MVDTPKLALPLLEATQGQKHLTFNEAITRLDLCIQLALNATDAVAPPSSPADGDAYGLSAVPTGDWSGQAHQVALYFDGIWHFASPAEGWLAWDKSLSALLIFQAGEWVGYSPSFAQLQSMSLVGINTTADATNRLAISSDAVLLSAETNDMRVKVNKSLTADTSAHLFQTGFSGRAEFGLLGNDDFTIKVSPDNFATSFDALKLDHTNGNAVMPQNVSIGHAGEPDSTVHIIGPTGSGATALTVDGDGGSGDKPLRVRDLAGQDNCIIYGDGDLVNQNNNYGSLSDARLKTDIHDAQSQWDDIKSVKLKKYRLKRTHPKSENRTHLGVLAQDLQKVSPGLVSCSENGMLGVRYSVLYLKALGALQEAMARIEKLESSAPSNVSVDGAGR